MLSLKVPGQTQAELGQAHVEQRMAGLDPEGTGHGLRFAA
jgi:hypothetical protein